MNRRYPIPHADGVEARFSAARLQLPLDTLLDGRPPRQPPAAARAPAIGTPPVSGLRLLPMGAVALREVLRLAASGRARIFLPLERTSFKVGPFSIDLSAGHEVIVELEVADGRVLRDRTRGTIEPAIALPLGIELRGVRLDEEGALIADIKGFPNLNLSRYVRAIPRIPATLDEALDLITQPRDKSDRPSPLDRTGVRVEAREVSPRPDALLDLGPFGRLRLRPGTRLDVDYKLHDLAIQGWAELDEAALHGRGFDLEGLAVAGRLRFHLTGEGEGRALSVEVLEARASLARAALALADGTHLTFSATSLDEAAVSYRAQPERSVYAVHVGRGRTQLDGGVLNLEIGGAPVPITIRPAALRGGFELRPGHLGLDLAFDGADLSLEDAAVQLGPVGLRLGHLHLRGRGRLLGATDDGFSFDGQAEAEADFGGSQLDLDRLVAELGEGSRGEVRLVRLTVDRNGPSELVASGRLALRLSRGVVPLGKSALLGFLPGAQGTLSLTTVKWLRLRRFPELAGGVTLEAESEPLLLDGAVEIPGGRAAIEADLTCDASGLFVLKDLVLALRSNT